MHGLFVQTYVDGSLTVDIVRDGDIIVGVTIALGVGQDPPFGTVPTHVTWRTRSLRYKLMLPLLRRLLRHYAVGSSLRVFYLLPALKAVRTSPVREDYGV